MRFGIADSDTEVEERRRTRHIGHTASGLVLAIRPQRIPIVARLEAPTVGDSAWTGIIVTPEKAQLSQQAIALGTRFIVAKSHSLITGFDCELGLVFMPVSVVER